MRPKYWLQASIALATFFTSGVAFTATYNFYFNNTEQGNNSKATPNLTVSTDGKSGGTELKPEPNPSASPGPQAIPAIEPEAADKASAPSAVTGPYSGPPSASTQIHIDQDELARESFKHFFFGPEVSFLKVSSKVEPNTGVPQTSFGIGVGYAFSSDFAVHIYGGRYETTDIDPTSGDYYSDGWLEPYTQTTAHYYGGGDLIATPIHLGNDVDGLDIGALVGANSIRAQEDLSAEVPGVGINLYVGALVRINIGRSVSIPVSYNAGSNASSLQAGLSVRL